MKFMEALNKWAEFLPPAGSKGLEMARRPMALHARVVDKSISHWMIAGIRPLGETFYRAAFFLEAFLGVVVDELDTSDNMEIRRLARTIGSGEDNLAYVASHIGFGDSTDNVLRLLRGGANTTADRIRQIRILNNNATPAMERKRREIANLRATAPTEARPPAATSPAPVSMPAALAIEPATQQARRGLNPEEKDRILRSVAYSAMSLLELAHLVASDEFSPDDRKTLRAYTATSNGGPNAIFALGNELSCLCSEEARKLARTKKS